MPAPKSLGVRRRCLSCASAFYDLGRTPIVCPKCGVEFTAVEYPHSPVQRKYGAPFPAVVRPEADAAPALEADPDETLDVEDDSEEALVADEDEERETV